jgi:hypothetical protein
VSFLPVIIPGVWYFVGVCPGCQKQRALGPAPPPNVLRIVKAWPHILTCDCGKETGLSPDEIQRLQAQGVRGQTLGPNAVFRLPLDK